MSIVSSVGRSVVSSIVNGVVSIVVSDIVSGVVSCGVVSVVVNGVISGIGNGVVRSKDNSSNYLISFIRKCISKVLQYSMKQLYINFIFFVEMKNVQ